MGLLAMFQAGLLGSYRDALTAWTGFPDTGFPDISQHTQN
jgi:hypothetical protein